MLVNQVASVPELPPDQERQSDFRKRSIVYGMGAMVGVIATASLNIVSLSNCNVNSTYYKMNYEERIGLGVVSLIATIAFSVLFGRLTR